MKSERETDWKLLRLYVVLALNGLTWLSFFFLVFAEKKSSVIIMGFIIVGVTSTWIFISHLFICRNKLSLSLVYIIYAVPSLSFAIMLPFVPGLYEPVGLVSPSKEYRFDAQRGTNFWELEFRDSQGEVINKFSKMFPANLKLKWQWDRENRLWVHSSKSDDYVFFLEKNLVTVKKWDPTMKLSPPRK